MRITALSVRSKSTGGQGAAYSTGFSFRQGRIVRSLDPACAALELAMRRCGVNPFLGWRHVDGGVFFVIVEDEYADTEPVNSRPNQYARPRRRYRCLTSTLTDSRVSETTRPRRNLCTREFPYRLRCPENVRFCDCRAVNVRARPMRKSLVCMATLFGVSASVQPSNLLRRTVSIQERLKTAADALMPA